MDGGLDAKILAIKFLSLGVDSCVVLQGCHNGLIIQIKEKYAPFVMGIHCIAHRCNFAFKKLSRLGIFASNEKLLLTSHTYFKRISTKHNEFKMFAKVTKTQGLKMLRHVQTRWVSLIKPFGRLLNE